MSVLGHVLFNLLANSVLAFVLTLGIVYATLRVFRFAPGRSRLWLLLLPFAKVLSDLTSGVPESSFLWIKQAGHVQDLGTFRIGFGIQNFWPLLDFQLGAFSGGVIYPQSAADVLDGALSKRIAPWAPGALAATILLIGIARTARRFGAARAFMRGLLAGTHVVDRRRAGRRVVEVIVSPHYHGVPFATGIVKPRIVFSAAMYAGLDAREREAALQHELAHVAHLDLPLLAALGVLSDLLWFLPGQNGLLARIHAVLEQRADDAALHAGALREALAAALVHAGELVRARVPGAAITSHPSLLAQRVRRLLDAAASPSRAHRLADLARVLLAAWVTLAVAQSLLLGNHVGPFVRFAHL